MSKPAMNNVVILAMLIMIALFNLESFLPASKTPVSRALLPSDAYVLKIELDTHTLERVGQQWRQVSTIDTNVPPSLQFSHWQRGILLPVAGSVPDHDKIAPLIAVVWLAGRTDGLVYAFYPSSEATFVHVNGLWFTLENTTVFQLLPWIKHNA